LHGRWQTLTILLAMLLSISILWSLQTATHTISASAIQTAGTIAVYWDPNCTTQVTTINWGNLSLGQTENTKLYIKNQASTPAYLIASDNNWNPTNAQNYIQFAFDIQGEKIEAGEVKNVTFALTASWETTSLSTFTFNVLIKALDSLPGDLNGDGTVNIKDIAILVKLFGTTPASPQWNPNADLNGNLRVDMRDIALAVQAFGNTAT